MIFFLLSAIAYATFVAVKPSLNPPVDISRDETASSDNEVKTYNVIAKQAGTVYGNVEDELCTTLGWSRVRLKSTAGYIPEPMDIPHTEDATSMRTTTQEYIISLITDHFDARCTARYSDKNGDTTVPIYRKSIRPGQLLWVSMDARNPIVVHATRVRDLTGREVERLGITPDKKNDYLLTQPDINADGYIGKQPK